MNCEQDIASHCAVEDHLLVPNVIELEKDIASQRHKHKATPASTSGQIANGGDNLSSREKEIVAAIAIGLSNKEIADRLCISVHTAATHRRNISSKLGIHSAAGLTIFAIVNNLVDVNDVKTIK